MLLLPFSAAVRAALPPSKPPGTRIIDTEIDRSWAGRSKNPRITSGKAIEPRPLICPAPRGEFMRFRRSRPPVPPPRISPLSGKREDTGVN